MTTRVRRSPRNLGIDGAAKHMAEIFEKALDLALEKKDPQRKLERRRKREAARSKTRPDEASLGAQAPRLHPSRHIPSSVRERLLERADYQCEFRGPGGVRCTARTRLEVDHPIPGREGRTARKTLEFSAEGTIFSLRSGSSGRSSCGGRSRGERGERQSCDG